MFPFSLPFSFTDFFVAAPHPGAGAGGGVGGAAALAVAVAVVECTGAFFRQSVPISVKERRVGKKRRIVLIDFSIFFCFSDLIILLSGECVIG